FGPQGGAADAGIDPDAGEVAMPPFDTQGSADTFVTALDKNGVPIWAKPLQLFSTGGTDSIFLGPSNRAFMTGGFNGSMPLDEYQLIHPHPAAADDQVMFIGGFRAPCGTPGCDKDPPTIVSKTVPGSADSTVNSPIIVYATERAGAVVHYNMPTAI